jgi:hypothetical protein
MIDSRPFQPGQALVPIKEFPGIPDGLNKQ